MASIAFRVVWDGLARSLLYISSTLCSTAVSKAFLSVFGSSCLCRQSAFSYSAGYNSRMQCEGGGVVLFLGKRGSSSQSVMSSERLMGQSRLVLLSDMSQLEASLSMNSRMSCSSRSKKQMQFFFRCQSKNMWFVRPWCTYSNALGLLRLQDRPPLKSTFKKVSISSSLTLRSYGFSFSLYAGMIPALFCVFFSRIRYPITCSNNPLSTRKQNSASMGNFQARKEWNSLSPGILFWKWLRESMRLTRNCSTLSLSLQGRTICRYTHSGKLMLRICVDFFLFSLQNFSQMPSTSSHKVIPDSRLGYMYIQTVRCRDSSLRSYPILTVRESVFLPPFNISRLGSVLVF